MFKDPKRLVEDLVVASCVCEGLLSPDVGCPEDISALGLRHVGYGIPTEFFAPFVPGAHLSSWERWFPSVLLQVCCSGCREDHGGSGKQPMTSDANIIQYSII